MDSGLLGQNGKVKGQNYLIQHLQADVQSVLPPFVSPVECLERFSGSIAKDFTFDDKDMSLVVSLV